MFGEFFWPPRPSPVKTTTTGGSPRRSICRGVLSCANPSPFELFPSFFFFRRGYPANLHRQPRGTFVPAIPILGRVTPTSLRQQPPAPPSLATAEHPAAPSRGPPRRTLVKQVRPCQVSAAVRLVPGWPARPCARGQRAAAQAAAPASHLLSVDGAPLSPIVRSKLPWLYPYKSPRKKIR
jgi:hypothetical protein